MRENDYGWSHEASLRDQARWEARSRKLLKAAVAAIGVLAVVVVLQWLFGGS
jgi:hypothetical protein